MLALGLTLEDSDDEGLWLLLGLTEGEVDELGEAEPLGEIDGETELDGD